MKCTVKSVNKQLPKFQTWSKWYRPREYYVGLIPYGVEILGDVYANYDPETFECTNITIYALCDAHAVKHHYLDNCVYVHDIFKLWALGELDRRQVAREIAARITDESAH